MKKTLPLLLAVLMVLSLIPAVTVSAGSSVDTVYLSDSGDDTNDGLTAATPVKTAATAVAKLDTASSVWTINAVGSVTWGTSDNWLLFKINDATKTVIFRGINDGAGNQAQFILSRSNVTLGANFTFDNLAIKSANPIYGYGKNVLFTETVTCIPSGGDATKREQFPALAGGNNGNGNGGTMTVNGGTFNYAYVGAAGAYTTTGKQTFTLGKNAKIMHTLHVDQVAFDELEINIYGDIVSTTGCVGLRFSNSNATVFNGDVTVNIYASAGNLNIKDASKLASGLADGKKAVFNFSHNPQVDEKFGEELAKTANFEVIRYSDKPVFVGTQIQGNSIRFAASVDTAEYRNVGFRIVATYTGGSKEFSLNCANIYEGLNGTENGEAVVYGASAYGASYLYALTVAGIPDLGDVAFSVTPIATDLTDNPVVGETTVVNCTVSGGAVVLK